jgi:hypothetical protein
LKCRASQLCHLDDDLRDGMILLAHQVEAGFDTIQVGVQ